MADRIEVPVADFTESFVPGNNPNATATTLGGIRVAQVDPSFSDLARGGRLYVASTGVVANASVVGADVATTAAQYCLWNGNATGSRGYALHIIRIGSWLASGTAGLGCTLMAGVSSAAQSTVSTMTGATVKPTSGSTARTSQAVLGITITLTGAPSWMALQSINTPAAVTVGGGPCANDINGALVVPPQYALGINMLAPAGTTSKWGCSILFAEIPTYISTS